MSVNWLAVVLGLCQHSFSGYFLQVVLTNSIQHIEKISAGLLITKTLDVGLLEDLLVGGSHCVCGGVYVSEQLG